VTTPASSPPAPPAPPPRDPNSLVEWAKSIAFAVVVYVILRIFLLQAFRIPSPSMERTLLIGDWLFVNKAIYGAPVPFTSWRTPAFREPARGDIVVFVSVETEGLDVVKRVIGVPGDTVEMRGHALFRNGAELEEPAARYDTTAHDTPPEVAARIRAWQLPHLARDTAGYRPGLEQWGPIVVPVGSLFVMGDNRDESYDGRYWGFLPRANVRGTPLFIYYSYDPATYKPLPFLTNIRWGRFFHVPR
jgi:signal peptidase I